MNTKQICRGDIVARKTYPPLTGRVILITSNHGVQFCTVHWFYDGGCTESRIPVAELQLAEVFK